MRTGPGLLGGFEHWFDGLGILVNFRFERGQVFWQQRFLNTVDYRMYREAGNKPQLTAFKFNPGFFKTILNSIKGALGLPGGVLLCIFLCGMIPEKLFVILFGLFAALHEFLVVLCS